MIICIPHQNPIQKNVGTDCTHDHKNKPFSPHEVGTLGIQLVIPFNAKYTTDRNNKLTRSNISKKAPLDWLQ